MARINYLKSEEIKDEDPLRKTANTKRIRRLCRIMEDLQGMGCSVRKDTSAEGHGWVIVVDGESSDLPFPDGRKPFDFSGDGYWVLSGGAGTATPTYVNLTCKETAWLYDAITGEQNDFTGTTYSAEVSGDVSLPDVVYVRIISPGAIDLFVAPITNWVDVVMRTSTSGPLSYYPLGLAYLDGDGICQIKTHWKVVTPLSRPLGNLNRMAYTSGTYGSTFAALKIEGSADVWLPQRDVWTPGGNKTLSASTITPGAGRKYISITWTKSTDTLAYGSAASMPTNDGTAICVAIAYTDTGGGSDGLSNQVHLEWTNPDPMIRFYESVPGGGADQMSLRKNSATNWDLEWSSPLPAGGDAGKVLKKNSGTDYDVYWGDDAT